MVRYWCHLLPDCTGRITGAGASSPTKKVFPVTIYKTLWKIAKRRCGSPDQALDSNGCRAYTNGLRGRLPRACPIIPLGLPYAIDKVACGSQPCTASGFGI